ATGSAGIGRRNTSPSAIRSSAWTPRKTRRPLTSFHFPHYRSARGSTSWAGTPCCCAWHTSGGGPPPSGSAQAVASSCSAGRDEVAGKWAESRTGYVLAAVGQKFLKLVQRDQGG